MTSSGVTRSMKPDSADLTSIAKNIALLASVYVYFIGWMYLYLYFRHFGIALLSLDVPVTFFFVYTYPLLSTRVSAAAVVVVVIALLIFVVVTSDRWNIAVRKWLMLLLTITLFPASFQAAKQAAEFNAKRFRQGYGAKVVQFTLSSESETKHPDDFIQANDSQQLLLLLETKDRFYVVYQPNMDAETELPIGSTYSVDQADVVVANIQLPNVSVKE